MKQFRIESAESIDAAINTLSANGRNSRILAGGTDLLGEIKEGTLEPDVLVALQSISDLSGIKLTDSETTIGALTTLSDLASNKEIASRYVGLPQAANSIATLQIRNLGTVGGNLCQRPRCWFYRSPKFDCSKKGGNTCFAVDANNKFHAIFQSQGCHIVHPSDLAVSLMSLNARVTISGTSGERKVPLDEFFAGPEVDITKENILKNGEILTSITIPAPAHGSFSTYLKGKERPAMDFALASVAMSATITDGRVVDSKTVLGGVATVPKRASEVDSTLLGMRVDQIDPDELGRLAVRDAVPLSDNRYKVRLTASLVARALRALKSQEVVA